MSTLNYSQPNFYKFNSDSIELVNYALTLLKERSTLSVLDLCAGCGIVGIDFYTKFKKVQKLSFVELQNEFQPHLIENLKTVKCNTEIHMTDFNDLVCEESYDVILCNPPYFLEGKGRVSPDENRQKCRATNAESISKLLEFCVENLRVGGVAIIVHREDLSLLDKRFEKVKEISGANLFRFILNIDRS